MNLYPWHKEIYLEIIKQHIIKKSHHARLIQSNQNLGTWKLVWNIAKWILCTQKTTELSCLNCNSCLLMDSNSHPDWYHIKKDINFNKIGISTINNLKNKINFTSQQKNGKVFFFTESEKLTDSSVNSLLKILEEPPKNNWFFFEKNNNSDLIKTLKSRCILHFLHPPKEIQGLKWLKKNINTSEDNYLTLLRISNNSPLEAKKIFTSSIWKLRQEFFNQVTQFIKKKTIISLITIFNKNINITLITWICMLLLDAIKYQREIYSFIINLDQKQLIEIISKNYKFKDLHELFKSWVLCYSRLISNIPINQELLILEQLIYWNNKFC